MRLAAVLALAIAAAACGPGARGGARAVQGVEAYVRALRADDPAAAWQLLSRDARAATTYEEFAARWNDTRAERLRQADELEDGLRGPARARERAVVRYADGKSVRLHRDDAGWKLHAGLVSRRHAREPRDAVEHFALGLRARSYEDVLTVLTQRRRDAITAQVAAFTDSLVRNLDSLHYEHMGADRAEARWEADGFEYRIVLLREDGEWRVDDFHIRKLPEP